MRALPLHALPLHALPLSLHASAAVSALALAEDSRASSAPLLFPRLAAAAAPRFANWPPRVPLVALLPPLPCTHLHSLALIVSSFCAQIFSAGTPSA